MPVELHEKGKASRQLVNAATEAGMTAGFEAEFYIDNVNRLYENYMMRGAKSEKDGSYTKLVKNLRFADIIEHFHPLTMNHRKDLDNQEVILKRLNEAFLDLHPESEDQVDDLSPEQKFEALKSVFKSVGSVIALLGIHSNDGYANLDDVDTSKLKKKITKIYQGGDEESIHQASALDRLKIITVPTYETPETYFKLDKTHYNSYVVFGLVADIFRKILGEPVVVSSNPDNNKVVSGGYKRWIVTSDITLESPGWQGKDQIGVELISPATDLPTMLGNLDRVFQIMKDLKRLSGTNYLTAHTDETTGLHVNLGLPGKILDMVKLVFMVGDDHQLEQWARKKNINAEPLYRDMISKIKSVDDVARVLSSRDIRNPFSSDDNEILHTILNAALQKDKFKSINLEKLFWKDGAFVEFRSAGNTDYEKRYDDLARSVRIFASMMVVSSDPELYRPEYLTKVYRVMKSIVDHTKIDPKQAKPPSKLNPEVNDVVERIIACDLRRVFKGLPGVLRYYLMIDKAIRTYQSTGVLNLYSFNAIVNNFLARVRVALADKRIDSNHAGMYKFHQLVVLLRSFGKLIRKPRVPI